MSIIEYFDHGNYRYLDLSDALLDVRDLIAAFEDMEADGADSEDFKTLSGILDELESMGRDEQWRGNWYPITLIRDSYFVEAMQELVQDIGDMPVNTPSYLEIDWEATADNLRVDYTSAEIEGTTYWYR